MANFLNLKQKYLNIWQSLQQWLDSLEIKQAETARRIVSSPSPEVGDFCHASKPWCCGSPETNTPSHLLWD